MVHLKYTWRSYIGEHTTERGHWRVYIGVEGIHWRVKRWFHKYDRVKRFEHWRVLESMHWSGEFALESKEIIF